MGDAIPTADDWEAAAEALAPVSPEVARCLRWAAAQMRAFAVEGYLREIDRKSAQLAEAERERDEARAQLERLRQAALDVTWYDLADDRILAPLRAVLAKLEAKPRATDRADDS